MCKGSCDYIIATVKIAYYTFFGFCAFDPNKQQSFNCIWKYQSRRFYTLHEGNSPPTHPGPDIIFVNFFTPAQFQDFENLPKIARKL